jgi:hypothetical protein
MWGWTTLELVLRDMKFALRQLRRSPGFTAIAILSLGLGVGANTAIFSIVKAMLLAPLPYPEGDRLVMVWEDVPRWDIRHNTPAPQNFLDWRSQNHVFESMAAFVGGVFGDVALTGAGDPEQIHGAQCLRIFRVLRVRPAFGTGRGDINWRRIAIISDSLWRRRFAATRDVVGRASSKRKWLHHRRNAPSFAFPTTVTGLDAAGVNILACERGDHFLLVVAG